MELMFLAVACGATAVGCRQEAIVAPQSLQDRRALVMGLGRHGGGAAAARYLAMQGARVTVTDLADALSLAGSIATLRNSPGIQFHLDGHNESDFREADLVVVNPAVRPGNPLLEIACQSGALLTSEIELFLNACPGRVVGVTGTNGKSTTAAMIAAILNADGRRCWLGGNIGGSLLDCLPEIRETDWIVLELSSFQLARLSPMTRMPDVAVVTCCSPNHLDWHGAYDEYLGAKQRLVTLATADATVVLNDEDPEVRTWRRLAAGTVAGAVADCEMPVLSVPGRHNRLNARLAAAAAQAIGVANTTILEALSTYRGLPRRLQSLGEIAGREFYDDSQATTPESTIAALESITRPCWLLAGGADKGNDWDQFCRSVADKAQGAAFFGRLGPRLHQLTASKRDGEWTSVDTLEAALAWCWEHSRSGEVILFSPAGASFDQYRCCEERGAEFVARVCALASQCEADARNHAQSELDDRRARSFERAEEQETIARKSGNR